jgi:hypothetical protein
MVSSRQYGPPSPLASAEGGGRAGERGGGSFQILPSQRTLRINWSPDFFHIIGEIGEIVVFLPPGATLLFSRPLAGIVFVLSCLLIGV